MTKHIKRKSKKKGENTLCSTGVKRQIEKNLIDLCFQSLFTGCTNGKAKVSKLEVFVILHSLLNCPQLAKRKSTRIDGCKSCGNCNVCTVLDLA